MNEATTDLLEQLRDRQAQKAKSLQTLRRQADDKELQIYIGDEIAALQVCINALVG